MLITLEKFLNYILCLNHLNKSRIIFLSILTIIGFSGCHKYLSSDIDTNAVLLNDSDPNRLESLGNYKNEILYDFITELSINGNEVILIPVNDFDYDVGDKHYIFYIVEGKDQIINEMLDAPASLIDKHFVSIKKIYIMDLNNDDNDDILIEFTYPIGFGKFAGHELCLYEIYFQTSEFKSHFQYKVELSKTTNDVVSKETKLINNDEVGMLENYIPDIEFVINSIKQQINN